MTLTCNANLTKSTKLIVCVILRWKRTDHHFAILTDKYDIYIRIKREALPIKDYPHDICYLT